MRHLEYDGSVSEDGYMDLPDTMKTRRATLGMSQAELSAASGLSLRQIARYEAGEQQPSLAGAVALAEALDMSLMQLAGQEPGTVDLAGDWWAAWETFKDGERRVAAHSLQMVQRGERIYVDADRDREPHVEDGRYRWRGELRLWDSESLIGWYRSTEPGVRSKGSMYFALNPHGHHAWGKWVGLSHDGLVVSGWSALGRTSDAAAQIVNKLVETGGASRGSLV
jgi:transcriptional regulator with XRE-family HTH domain